MKAADTKKESNKLLQLKSYNWERDALRIPFLYGEIRYLVCKNMRLA